MFFQQIRAQIVSGLFYKMSFDQTRDSLHLFLPTIPCSLILLLKIALGQKRSKQQLYNMP